MPVLDQLIAYNEAYIKRYVTDAFDLNYSASQQVQPYVVQQIRKSFSLREEAKEKLKQVFDLRKRYHVFLLFIDITSFSKLTSNKSGEYICDFLDDYYKQVIPIIYEYGGQIEKIMGDGIICVFGSPFLNDTNRDCMLKAENCAMKIIRNFKGTNFSSKVALHNGEVVYYKNSNVEYEEYTMVGTPLTELFRLESISVDNSINYFVGTLYDDYNKACASNSYSQGIINVPWSISSAVNISLKGVSYSQMKYLSLVW